MRTSKLIYTIFCAIFISDNVDAQDCTTTITCAQQAVEIAQEARDMMEDLIPKGAVIAFNSTKCPSIGWREFEPAYGRFIRGIDRSSGEKPIDPDGERPPGDPQGYEVQTHYHLLRGRRVAVPHNGGGHALGDLGEVNFNTEPTGEKETRPVNVALLYCERI